MSCIQGFILFCSNPDQSCCPSIDLTMVLKQKLDKDFKKVSKRFWKLSMSKLFVTVLKGLDWPEVILDLRRVSMTSLLAHTVAQPTKWRFLPKNLNQLVIFVIGLAFTWSRVDKNRAQFQKTNYFKKWSYHKMVLL